MAVMRAWCSMPVSVRQAQPSCHLSLVTCHALLSLVTHLILKVADTPKTLASSEFDTRTMPVVVLGFPGMSVKAPLPALMPVASVVQVTPLSRDSAMSTRAIVPLTVQRTLYSSNLRNRSPPVGAVTLIEARGCGCGCGVA